MRYSFDMKLRKFFVVHCLATVIAWPLFLCDTAAAARQFVVEGKRLLLKDGNKLVMELSLQTVMPSGTYDDEAVPVANCMVLYRGIIPAGNRTAPQGVELVTLEGKRQSIAYDRVGNFEGVPYTHASGLWGVILNYGEGMLDGYLFLRADGTFKEQGLGSAPIRDLDGVAVSFQNDLHVPIITSKNSKANLVIHPDGSYAIQ